MAFWEMAYDSPNITTYDVFTRHHLTLAFHAGCGEGTEEGRRVPKKKARSKLALARVRTRDLLRARQESPGARHGII